MGFKLFHYFFHAYETYNIVDCTETVGRGWLQWALGRGWLQRTGGRGGCGAVYTSVIIPDLIYCNINCIFCERIFLL